MMALINSLLTLSKQVRANICAMIFAKCRRLHFSLPTPLRRGARRNVQCYRRRRPKIVSVLILFFR